MHETVMKVRISVISSRTGGQISRGGAPAFDTFPSSSSLYSQVSTSQRSQPPRKTKHERNTSLLSLISTFSPLSSLPRVPSPFSPARDGYQPTFCIIFLDDLCSDDTAPTTSNPSRRHHHHHHLLFNFANTDLVAARDSACIYCKKNSPHRRVRRIELHSFLFARSRARSLPSQSQSQLSLPFQFWRRRAVIPFRRHDTSWFQPLPPAFLRTMPPHSQQSGKTTAN
jgi:hypothetical protein